MSFLWRGHFASGEPAPHTGSDFCHQPALLETGAENIPGKAEAGEDVSVGHQS